MKVWGALCPIAITGPPLEYGGGGAGVFLEINIVVGKIGEINKWPPGMVEINILSTKEVEINISIEINIFSLSSGEKTPLNPHCEGSKYD